MTINVTKSFENLLLMGHLMFSNLLYSVLPTNVKRGKHAHKHGFQSYASSECSVETGKFIARSTESRQDIHDQGQELTFRNVPHTNSDEQASLEVMSLVMEELEKKTPRILNVLKASHPAGMPTVSTGRAVTHHAMDQN